MAVFVKLRHGAVRLLLVGDGDGGILCLAQRAVGIGVGAADERHVQQRDLAGRIIAAPAKKHDAAQALFALHHRAAFQLVVARGDLPHDHRVARGVQPALDGMDDVGIKRILHAAHHQADRI